MPRTYHRLGRRQIAVLNDMFDNGLTESEAIAKNNVSRWLFLRWVSKPAFKGACEIRQGDSLRLGERLICKNLPRAAQKLSELIAAEKDAISIKACSDLIALKRDPRLQPKPETKFPKYISSNLALNSKS
jgi:hypothetical protein